MTMEKYKTIHENKVLINPPEEIKQFKQSPLQRILRVMKFYYNRGINSERCNIVYRNIIKKNKCKYCHQENGVHKMSCSTQKITVKI